MELKKLQFIRTIETPEDMKPSMGELLGGIMAEQKTGYRAIRYDYFDKPFMVKEVNEDTVELYGFPEPIPKEHIGQIFTGGKFCTKPRQILREYEDGTASVPYQPVYFARDTLPTETYNSDVVLERMMVYSEIPQRILDNDISDISGDDSEEYY